MVLPSASIPANESSSFPRARKNRNRNFAISTFLLEPADFLPLFSGLSFRRLWTPSLRSTPRSSAPPGGLARSSAPRQLCPAPGGRAPPAPRAGARPQRVRPRRSEPDRAPPGGRAGARPRVPRSTRPAPGGRAPRPAPAPAPHSSARWTRPARAPRRRSPTRTPVEAPRARSEPSARAVPAPISGGREPAPIYGGRVASTGSPQASTSPFLFLHILCLSVHRFCSSRDAVRSHSFHWILDVTSLSQYLDSLSYYT